MKKKLTALLLAIMMIFTVPTAIASAYSTLPLDVGNFNDYGGGGDWGGGGNDWGGGNDFGGGYSSSGDDELEPWEIIVIVVFLLVFFGV